MLALMQRYLREVTPAKKGAIQEGYHMRPLMRSKIAAYTPATLTPQAVREWRDERLRTACGTTVNRQLNLLHHVIEHARKEWGIGNGNACLMSAGQRTTGRVIADCPKAKRNGYCWPATRAVRAICVTWC
jgi:hypothetical protein